MGPKHHFWSRFNQNQGEGDPCLKIDASEKSVPETRQLGARLLKELGEIETPAQMAKGAFGLRQMYLLTFQTGKRKIREERISMWESSGGSLWGTPLPGDL